MWKQKGREETVASGCERDHFMRQHVVREEKAEDISLLAS